MEFIVILLASECKATFTAFEIIFFVKSEPIIVLRIFNPSITTVDNSMTLIVTRFLRGSDLN